MQLDVSTLMVAGGFVALMSGAFLLYVWRQYRETRAALWWAGADLFLACGLVALAIGSGADDRLILIAGSAFMCLSSILTWAGARSFDRHEVSPAFLALGALIWVGAQWLPNRALTTPTVAALLSISIAIVYYGAAAVSIAMGRKEALRARLPLAVLLAAHTLTLMIALSASLTMTLQPNQPPPVMGWLGGIYFELLSFAIGTAIFLIVMVKERNEGRLLATSHTDALTGVANRRGFFLKAERILARCRHDGAPLAVVAFDLDHFKAINDMGGHATGDRVLQIFAEICGNMLRPGDVIGRLGGEEFAAILPGSGIEAGYAMAERLRKAVEDAGAIVGGSPVHYTVSGGVAASLIPDDIHALLRQADVGLYTAKSLGRNRIERFGAPSESRAAANVIRIA
jgi:diguanylate cyclase (GGDEF)-like protein